MLFITRPRTSKPLTARSWNSTNSRTSRRKLPASFPHPHVYVRNACTWKSFLHAAASSSGNKKREREKKRDNGKRKKDNEDDWLNEGQRTKGRQKRRVPMQLRGFGALNVYASMWHASSRDESRAWSLYYSHAAAFRGCVRCIRTSRFRKNALLSSRNRDSQEESEKRFTELC